MVPSQAFSTWVATCKHTYGDSLHRFVMSRSKEAEIILASITESVPEAKVVKLTSGQEIVVLDGTPVVFTDRMPPNRVLFVLNGGKA